MWPRVSGSRPLIPSKVNRWVRLWSSLSQSKVKVIQMAKHKSVEARRLTELGRGLHAWYKVLYGDLFNNPMSVADCSAKAAMREIALMDNTHENREMLREAAYCCGLPEREADALAQWAARGDDLLKYGHDVMCDDLAEYVRGTWPDIEELADMACDADDVADRLFAETRPASDVMLFRRGSYLLTVRFDTDAAEAIAMSCPDLDNPPIGIAMAVNDGGVEHMVCTTVDQAVEAVVDRIHRFDTEG